MIESFIQLSGMVLLNGSLQLDSPVDMPPGPVRVTICQAGSGPSGNPSRWLQVVQETRAELESLGIPMMDDEMTNSWVRSLREADSLDDGRTR